MRRLVVLLSAALSLVAGCSLQGLDRFDWPTCDQCDVLNTRDGIPEGECERWLCDRQTQQCVFGLRDDDGDGHAPQRCGGDDCDDTAATAYAGASELCNGIDDDCNGWIDDAAADAASPDDVLAAPQPPRWLAAEPVEGGILAAYQTAGGAGVEVVSDPTADVTAGQPLVLASSAPPYSLLSEGIADGCVTPRREAVSTVTFEPCADTSPECPDGQQCYQSVGGARLCGTPIPGTPPTPPTCRSDAECDDGNVCNGSETCEPLSGASDPVTGCRPARAPGCSPGRRCIPELGVCEALSDAPATCGIADAAIAGTGNEYLAAAVTTMGCAAGALRLGYFVESDRAPASRYPVRRIVQRGDQDGVRSTSWLGIDVEAMAACPGPETGRPEDAPRGVAGPAIAALPIATESGRLRPQALVAYLAGPVCRSLGNCPASGPARLAGSDGPLDVELIGVWMEEGATNATPIGWVNASGSGEPVRLGIRTNGGATRPAVSAWTSGEHAGYFVAYPKESGGIALHVVPAMPDPSPECPRRRGCTEDGDCGAGEVCAGTFCRLATPECTDDDECGALEVCDERGRCAERPCVSRVEPRNTLVSDDRRTTPDLDVPAATQRFSGETVTGDVVMAVGRTREDGVVELALAWEVDGAIAVALATYDPATDTFTEGRIERFDATDPRALTITHVDEGFVREGAAIDGEPVDDDARGGFVVVWRDDAMPTMAGGDETRAVRFADYDGSMVPPGAVVIGRGSEQPRVWVDGTGTVRVLAHQGDAFAVIPAVCGQRAR